MESYIEGTNLLGTNLTEIKMNTPTCDCIYYVNKVWDNSGLTH